MSFLPSSAHRMILCAVAVAAILGCGSNDGNKDFDRGQAAYAVGDYKKAERFFEASLKCAPANVDRMLMLARARIGFGDIDGANEIVGRAMAIAENDFDVVMLDAQVAWHLKDYTRAANGYTKLAENTTLEAAVRSQAFAELGVVEMCRDQQRMHFARVALLKAIRLDRRNAAAWYHLGLLYRDGFGYPEAALEQFDYFIRLDDKASPRVQKVQLKVIPELKESIARSAADRPGASKRDSAASAAAITKAETEWKKGTYKSARSSYEAALKADPLSAPAALGLAKAWSKTDQTKAGQLKAYENYKTACALNPGQVSTFLTTGALAMQLGYHAQAVEIYSRAVAADPDKLDALDGLIRAFGKVGKNAAVAQAYQSYRDMIRPAKRK